MPPIPEPDIDGVTGEILNAYSIISRSRQFAGMSGAPLPLSLADIDRYLASCNIMIERDEFEAAIFAIDDAWREKWASEQKKPNKPKR